jgi:hypothetical protein
MEVSPISPSVTTLVVSHELFADQIQASTRLSSRAPPRYNLRTQAHLQQALQAHLQQAQLELLRLQHPKTMHLTCLDGADSNAQLMLMLERNNGVAVPLAVPRSMEEALSILKVRPTSHYQASWPCLFSCSSSDSVP